MSEFTDKARRAWYSAIDWIKQHPRTALIIVLGLAGLAAVAAIL